MTCSFRRAAAHALAALGVALAAAPAAAPPAAAGGADATVAVAANFTAAAREIGRRFTAATGHRVEFSFASTGALYAQIANGAPFDVYLAADRARPEKAVAAGLAVAESRTTYATGRLVLYSAEADRAVGPDALRAGAFTRLAVANPETAPYGAAAIEVLTALGVRDSLAPKLVQGSSIAQTYQFVATGNAELGLVAAAQVAGHEEGSRWPVPERLHAPIAQDAVLLIRGADNAAARAFLAFLQGPEAAAVKRRLGYGPGDGRAAAGS